MTLKCQKSATESPCKRRTNQSALSSLALARQWQKAQERQDHQTKGCDEYELSQHNNV